LKFLFGVFSNFKIVMSAGDEMMRLLEENERAKITLQESEKKIALEKHRQKENERAKHRQKENEQENAFESTEKQRQTNISAEKLEAMLQQISIDDEKIEILRKVRTSIPSLLESVHHFYRDEHIMTLANIVKEKCDAEKVTLRIAQIIGFVTFICANYKKLEVVELFAETGIAKLSCIKCIGNDFHKQKLLISVKKSITKNHETMNMYNLRMCLRYVNCVNVNKFHPEDYYDQLGSLKNFLPFVQLGPEECIYDILEELDDSIFKEGFNLLKAAKFS